MAQDQNPPKTFLAPSAAAVDLRDSQLLYRFISERDESAFAELVHRQGPLVLTICRRVLGNEEDAEDAFQAVYLVLVRKAKSIRRLDSLASWLHGVAYRLASKAKIAAARRRRHEKEVAAMTKSEIQDKPLGHDLAAAIHEEMHRLPERYRAPLVLCLLGGKSTDDAASTLGCPRGTIATRLARGRTLLCTRLTRRGITLSVGLIAAALSQKTMAAVPRVLFRSVVQAAMQSLGGSALAAIPPKILLLVQGELHAMFLTKLKAVILAVAAVSVLGIGAFYFASRAGEPKATPGQSKPKRDVAADKKRSKENLFVIGKAMHAYVAKTGGEKGHFPTYAVFSKGGKPLLSWRVSLLPYLDQEELYKQFKLDESWDSEHNKKLLAKMPSVYAPPGIKTKEPNTTFYQVFVGKGAVFEGAERIMIKDIRGGTSHTAMAVEAGAAVPWTKPEDVAFDPEKEILPLGGIFEDGFHLLAADGFVHYIEKGFDKEKLHQAIERDTGVGDWKSLTK